MKKDSYKIAFLLGFFFLLPCALFTQEQLTFVAERDTVAFGDRIELLIQAGETITTDATILYGRTHINPDVNLDEHQLIIAFGERFSPYYTFAKNFRPANTEDVFGEDIFIDYPMDRRASDFINTWGSPPAAIGDAMWVPDFYADVLRGQDRNKLLNIRPRLEIRDDGDNPWYMNSVVNLRFGRAMFYNSAIMLGDETHLAIRNIRRTDFGYRVDAVISAFDWRIDSWALLADSAFWAAYGRGDSVTLLLHLDGDYLDIFTDSGIYVETFIRVGREFQTQYQSLIRWNTSDLTNVIWPRRADGSTGIRPVVVAPTAVHEEIIEEPDGNGYETIAITQPEEIIGNFVNQESSIAQNTTGSRPIPVWLRVAGGVVVVGGAGVFISRRKR